MSKENSRSLIISSLDVQKIVHKVGLDKLMDTIISRLTFAIANYDSDKIDIPIRSGFNYSLPKTGLIEWMPVYQKGEEVIIKVVGYHPNNPKLHGLPTIVSTISSYSTHTGNLKGILDGVLPTAFRTGAASALASRLMAKPNSSILGLIGCGAQAVTQFHALSRIFGIEKVLIYDIDQESTMNFQNRCSAFNHNAEIIVADIDKIMSESDIVCSATSIGIGEGPLFHEGIYKKHLHVNAVGSDFAGKVELPLSLLKQSFVAPDFKNQAEIEGECQQLSSLEIGPELSELVQNYEDHVDIQNRITVFDSTGWALEDKVMMDLFMEYALKFGYGTTIQIESISQDAKNPYAFANQQSDTERAIRNYVMTRKEV